MSNIKTHRFIFVAVMLLAAVVTAVLSSQTVAAAGATAFQTDVSYLGTPPPHPCTGAALEASGNVTVVMHQTKNGYFFHIGPGQSNVTMTDITSSENYLFTGALNERVKLTGTGTAVHHLNYISPGSSVNFVGQLLTHVTITPDGETTVSFDWGSFSCK